MNILILNLLKYFPSNSPLTQKEKKKNNLVSRANIYTHTHTHTHTQKLNSLNISHMSQRTVRNMKVKAVYLLLLRKSNNNRKDKIKIHV